ncbi:MAG: TetR/AcrR family transcriptional regulator [Candidatus Cloacimonadales bacterium]|nr:TetR/AcrR family transcriptional regulator [Candidatus Cloacimonadales bacterium]
MNARFQSDKVKQKKHHKRTAIIEAAIETFAKKGFHKTKISDIARAADVADGTVYLYFDNKDDLLIKSFDELISGKLNELKKLVEGEETFLARLTMFFDYHVKLFTEKPYIARFMAIELRQSTEFYKKFPDYQPIKRYLNYLQELIDEAKKEGNLRDVDTLGLSYLMFGTMDFVLTEWSTREQSFDLLDIKDKIVDIVRYGMYPIREH